MTTLTLPKSSVRASDLNTLLLSGQAMDGESHQSLATQRKQHRNQELMSNQIITISEVADGLDKNMAKHVFTNIVDFGAPVGVGGNSDDMEQGGSEENNTKIAIVKASMSTLPTDAVIIIFEALPHATAACLGLTCRGLYACLKKHHPQPICLGSSTCSDSPVCFPGFPERRIYLWQLLKNWMGAKYKFRTHEVGDLGNPKCVKRFLNLKLYSELEDFRADTDPPTFENEGRQYCSRYLDWAKTCVNPKKPINCRYQKFESRLPNPFNKGRHDWFPEAIEVIKADTTRFKNIGEWRTFWSSYFIFHDSKNIFDGFFDECSLDQMSEGLGLLGLLNCVWGGRNGGC